LHRPHPASFPIPYPTLSCLLLSFLLPPPSRMRRPKRAPINSQRSQNPIAHCPFPPSTDSAFTHCRARSSTLHNVNPTPSAYHSGFSSVSLRPHTLSVGRSSLASSTLRVATTNLTLDPRPVT
jgi:hypothetical protein